MISALDTSLVLDLFTNSAYGEAGERALRAASMAGALVVGPPVWAEVRPYFPSDDAMAKAMDGAGIQLDVLDRACANFAGCAGCWTIS